MIYQKPTRTVTEAYTTADADNGCRIICNSASTFEVTLHTATGRYNFDLEVDNIGAGAVTVSGQTVAQYGHAHIGCDGTSWIVTVSGGGSGGAVDSVNGETGEVVLSAADIDITDSGSHFTATDVEGALTELFTSGSNGKAALETAIETKGGTVDKAGDIATFSELEDGIDSIPTGGGTYQSKTVTPDAAGQTVTPDTGYDALSQVTINGDADLTAGNIKKDIVVFGVTGTYEGSGGGNYCVRFFDYDGTILKTAYANSGGSVTAPSDPSHTGLTFQGWNYSSTKLSNITSDLDVGAHYTTSDGKTKFIVRVTTQVGLSVTANFTKSDTSTLSIDWGDSNTSTITTSGAVNSAHTYAAVGDYTITCYISSGSGTYSLGRGSSSTTAIYASSRLLSAFIGDDVTGFTNSAFQSCSSMETISIPNTVTSIGTDVFNTCKLLKFCVIPSGITSVQSNLFNACYSLEQVSLPSSITSIGSQAFNTCYSLKSIVIPSDIDASSDSAFQGCSSLTSFLFPSGGTSINSYYFNACSALKNVSIPSGIESIGSYAFQNNHSLTMLDLPSTITSIANYAFRYCTTTLVYIFRSTTPPTLGGTSVFQSINTLCKIYVPDASVDAYKAATYWSSLANYIYPLSEYGG